MGLNVMRIFAHTTDPNFVLQANPGEYNEKVQLHCAPSMRARFSRETPRQHAQVHVSCVLLLHIDGVCHRSLQVFKALDFVLVEARRYGLRVILSVLDNWKYSGGIDEFVDWSDTSPRRTRERPADKAGDTATHVRRLNKCACMHACSYRASACRSAVWAIAHKSK